MQLNLYLISHRVGFILALRAALSGATPARALFPDQAKASSGGSNVSIAARVRPLNADKEVHNGVTVRDNAICFQSSSRNAQNGASTPRAQPQNVFLYDAVFGESASQADVFALAEERVLASFVEGYHGTIFTYGQVCCRGWVDQGTDNCNHCNIHESSPTLCDHRVSTSDRKRQDVVHVWI